MTAEIRNTAIVATEHIKAPPAVVFPYFTDPALIVRWIGQQAQLDPQPGGVFALDMGEVAAHGTYIAVEPPHRVVFSWGIPGNETLPPGGSIVEVLLTADGDDTIVVLTHHDLPPTHLDTHHTGWEHQLSRLADAVERTRTS